MMAGPGVGCGFDTLVPRYSTSAEVPATALSIMATTRSGAAWGIAWLVSTSSSVAPMRAAMSRWISGRRCLSLEAIRYQLGFDAQAGTGVDCVKIASA